jgi:hypothetical protein
MIDLEILSTVLDRLLPANQGLPPAGQMGLARAVLEDASSGPALESAMVEAVTALPDNFILLSGDAQDEALRTVEAAAPAAFAGLLKLAYSAYYGDERVLGEIERQTGYDPSPPQPRGYELAEFDDSLLAQVRQRPALWRKVEPS